MAWLGGWTYTHQAKTVPCEWVPSIVNSMYPAQWGGPRLLDRILPRKGQQNPPTEGGACDKNPRPQTVSGL